MGDRWRGWRLLQLADLRSDDQRLRREHPLNGKHCPGVNQGKFDGVHTGFVFTLVRESGEQVVVVAAPNGDSFTATVLAKPIKVPLLQRRQRLSTRHVQRLLHWPASQIRADSAAVEAIEASVTLSYFEGGRWKSLLISD